MKKVLLAASFLMFSVQPAVAGPYNDAVLAYQAGQLPEAVESFYELAKENDPDAQYILGTLFERGDQIEANIPQAISLYEQAARLNNPFAQAALGRLLVQGEHMERDDARALSLFIRAASQGHPASQYNAAVMLDKGIGTEPNAQEAMHWYEKAALNGHAGAQLHMGATLAQSTGNPEQLAQAHAWLDLASQSESREVAQQAKIMRDRLALTMTAPTLIIAKQAAQQLQSLTVTAPHVAIKGGQIDAQSNPSH